MSHSARAPGGELIDVRTANPSRFRVIAAVAGSPIAWTLHLMASYVMVAAWCAEEWGGLGVVLAVTTIACAGLAVASGFIALGLWRDGRAMRRHDAEPGSPEGWAARMGERGARVSFLAVMAIGGAVLFTYLIVLQGLPPLFTPACWAGVSG